MDEYTNGPEETTPPPALSTPPGPSSDGDREATSTASEVRSLHRSATKKIFGGVCGGLSERFDVDVAIVRVVFVVASFVWGLGVAVYLAMWALIPRSTNGSVEEVVVDEESTRRIRWLRYAIPLGVIVLAVIAIATLHNVPRLGRGLSLVWVIFLVVLAVAALRTPSRLLTFRRFLALTFLGFLSLLIVLSGVFLIAVEVTGVPVRGGSGLKDWAPNNVAEVQRNYYGAFGSSTVDLSNVHFPSGVTNVNVTQGVGTVSVDVPDNVVIYLRSHVGIGNIWRSQSLRSGYLANGKRITAATPRLDLDVQVGIGHANVYYSGRYGNR